MSKRILMVLVLVTVVVGFGGGLLGLTGCGKYGPPTRVKRASKAAPAAAPAPAETNKPVDPATPAIAPALAPDEPVTVLPSATDSEFKENSDNDEDSPAEPTDL